MNIVKKNKLKPKNIIRIFILIILTFITLCPFLILVMVSLKTKSDFMLNPLGIPIVWNFQNYITVFKRSNIMQSFLNSSTITVISVLFQIVFGAMVGYALTKMSFKHSKVFTSLFLVPMIFPIQAIMIPIYIIFIKLGLVNTYFGLIIIYIATGLALVIFMMTSFMRTIPIEISESAFVEGAGHLTIFFKLILPLLKPIVATTAIISGLSIWNDFFMPLIMITKKDLKTLPLKIYDFMGQYSSDWTLIATCIVFVIVPIIIVYCMLQKYIISGVAAGAIKG